MRQNENNSNLLHEQKIQICACCAAPPLTCVLYPSQREHSHKIIITSLEARGDKEKLSEKNV